MLGSQRLGPDSITSMSPEEVAYIKDLTRLNNGRVNMSYNFKFDTVAAGPNMGPPLFMKDLERMSREALLNEKDFFSGTCSKCAMVAKDIRLQRCAGCQLVAYCNKNCQKLDWPQHKILCKEFPVKNGKNVIVRKTESVGKDNNRFLSAMEEIKLSASRLSLNLQRTASVLCANVRVCNVCHEARPEKLFDCHCCAVSYCSSEHRMQDVIHLTQCEFLYDCAMANWYLTEHQQLNIPEGLLEEANLNELIQFEKVSKLPKYCSEKWLETIVNLINERLSFPLTIYHALKTVKLGEQRKLLSEITSLTIHIVHMIPMLDPRIWEFFLHQLPNLKTLNITFISAGIRVDNKYNSCLEPLVRCSDCKKKQRIITYETKHAYYHKYFNAKDYEQPDVVAVFAVDRELMKFNCLTSERNMTNSKNTVVILTSVLGDSLESCMKRFQNARPVKVLLPIQNNPVCGFSTYRSHDYVIHENEYICGIQREH